MTRCEATAPGWRTRLAAVGVTNPAALLDSPRPPGATAANWQCLHKPGLGGRERWRWKPEHDDEATVVYVKRYGSTTFAEQLDRIRRQSLFHSRASWEYRQSERLAAQDVAVPGAVGFAEEMTGALEHRSVVLLEQVPGDALDRVWTRRCAERAPCTRGRARHETVVRLARFIADFHKTGFCHRDLYLCHVFVVLRSDGARAPAFSLIDLARTHRPRWRRMRWIVKDLAQLDCSARQIGATRTDRLRFLRAYLERRGDRATLRLLLRRVSNKSNRILRRIQRKSERG